MKDTKPQKLARKTAADAIELEIAESHLANCSRCAAEADELDEFRLEQMNRKEAARSSLWSVFSEFWSRPLFRLSFQFAGAAAAILMIVVFATLPLQREVADLHARLDAAQQQNDELQSRLRKSPSCRHGWTNSCELRQKLRHRSRKTSTMPAGRCR